MGHLDEVDLSLSLSSREEERELKAAWKRLSQLRLTLGGLIGEKALGPPLCVVFEGWDASGKGGAIKRLTAPLDPRHVRVAQFAAPSADELRHHFLHRFWPALPGWGGMTVFDRSWYGRVLVERFAEGVTDVGERELGSGKGEEPAEGERVAVVVAVVVGNDDLEGHLLPPGEGVFEGQGRWWQRCGISATVIANS